MTPVSTKRGLKTGDTVPLSAVTQRRKQGEARLQMVIVSRLRAMFDLVLLHVPNGNNRNALAGRRLKYMGVLAGAPDLIAFYEGGRTLMLELKWDKGKESAEQLALHEELRRLGHQVVTVRTLDEALDACRAAGVPDKQPRVRSDAENRTGF